MRPGGGVDIVKVRRGDAGPERPEPRTSDRPCRSWGAISSDSAAEVDRGFDTDDIDTYITVKDDQAGSTCEVLSDERLGRNVSVYDRNCPKAER